jgi:hypothetical protein
MPRYLEFLLNYFFILNYVILLANTNILKVLILEKEQIIKPFAIHSTYNFLISHLPALIY